MAYNEQLATRVRTAFKGKKGLNEIKMFGGLCFTIYGNMALGVEKDNLMVRVGPEKYEEALKQKHARPMDFTGRPLKGFVYISPAGYKTSRSLAKWVERGTAFAQSLPKKLK